MITTCIKLTEYEMTGFEILKQRRRQFNRSEIIRTALRKYFRDEGIEAKEIETEIKSA